MNLFVHMNSFEQAKNKVTHTHTHKQAFTTWNTIIDL